MLLAPLDTGGGGQRRKVVSHVVHVSGASLRFSPGFLMSVQFSYAWHAQARVDYGARVKLGAIARIRFGIDVYGMSDCLHVLIYAWIGGFCSRRCSVPTWERRCHTF